MTSKWLLNMSIKFYTSPRNFIPPKQISGYAPATNVAAFSITRRETRSLFVLFFVSVALRSP